MREDVSELGIKGWSLGSFRHILREAETRTSIATNIFNLLLILIKKSELFTTIKLICFRKTNPTHNGHHLIPGGLKPVTIWRISFLCFLSSGPLILKKKLSYQFQAKNDVCLSPWQLDIFYGHANGKWVLHLHSVVSKQRSVIAHCFGVCF